MAKNVGAIDGSVSMYVVSTSKATIITHDPTATTTTGPTTTTTTAVKTTKASSFLHVDIHTCIH